MPNWFHDSMTHLHRNVFGAKFSSSTKKKKKVEEPEDADKKKKKKRGILWPVKHQTHRRLAWSFYFLRGRRNREAQARARVEDGMDGWRKLHMAAAFRVFAAGVRGGRHSSAEFSRAAAHKAATHSRVALKQWRRTAGGLNSRRSVGSAGITHWNRTACRVVVGSWKTAQKVSRQTCSQMAAVELHLVKAALKSLRHKSSQLDAARCRLGVGAEFCAGQTTKR